MKKHILAAVGVAFAVGLASIPSGVMAADDGWTSLFDGKSLEGWKASEAPGTFSVQEGKIVVNGPRSHLYYLGSFHNHDFKNFELKADVMTFTNSNSGIYFHTAWQDKGFPDKGFEIQVNNTHRDTKRTAGIYDVKDNYDTVAKDEVWFTMEIIVKGKHVVTKVDGKVVEDWTEPEDPKTATPALLKKHPQRVIDHGTFALQGHDPGSKVYFKNIMVRPLPE